MKFFHLSDLHIGLKLMNHDLSRDQEYILKQIIETAKKKQPDALIIAGDIYDKSVPSAEAVALFDNFITELSLFLPKMEIMLISGNHDSAQRINAFRSLLCHHHLHMIGLPPAEPDEYIEKVTLSDEHGPVHFYLLPFVKPSMVKAITGTDESGNNLTYDAALHALIEREKIDSAARNVLVSHQFYLSTGKSAEEVPRADSEIVTVGNIDSVNGDVLELFDYAALGHIHQPMQLNGKECYRYCGTPLSCSVSEAGQEKGIIEVELGPKGKVITSDIPLKPLHEVRKLTGKLAEVLQTPSEDYVSITLTDEKDLDVFDMQDRLSAAFPNLLEVRRNARLSADYETSLTPQARLSPFELCKDFLTDLEPEEEALLADIINSVQDNREARP
ncbi:MAG: exonuclease SbcCD subunit D [Selenomonas ruminantium]|nr:exonuclease SbcCD subunit D [Selenomonas ruminantium]